ncbi:MAG: porin family protein [Rickettsiales bacterium]|jgi:opacity protein-like surface antigen|nr:porin family protein [Rickettsiales bacterium]
MIKKELVLIAVIAASVAPNAASAAAKVYRQVYTSPDAMYMYNEQKDAPVGRWSFGARFDYTLASFKNKYSLGSGAGGGETDSFSFKPQMGFDVSAGYQIDDKWRVELNYGYTGKYEDNDSDMAYDIAAQFLTINGVYTIKEWTTTSLFVGGGLGAGYLTTRFTAPLTFHPSAETSESSIGFTGALQFGVEEKLSDNVRLGLTYKLGYLTGHKQEIELAVAPADSFISENTGVLSNTLGIGIRYTF